jgi:hypothetical protein
MFSNAGLLGDLFKVCFRFLQERLHNGVVTSNIDGIRGGHGSPTLYFCGGITSPCVENDESKQQSGPGEMTNQRHQTVSHLRCEGSRSQLSKTIISFTGQTLAHCKYYRRSRTEFTANRVMTRLR